MGRLSHPIHLSELVLFYNINNYIETGFGDGTSMRDVFSLNTVTNLYGIDLDPVMCKNISMSEMRNSVKVYNGYSKDELPNVLNDLDDNPTLFWLDAHFPDSDYNGAPYDSEPDEDKRIPLKIELEIIKEKRIINNDIFIIDDLRIYVDRNYQGGSWPLRHIAGADGYDFVKEILDDTHLLFENYKDQGYLLAFPRSSNLDIVKSFIKEY